MGRRGGDQEKTAPPSLPFFSFTAAPQLRALTFRAQSVPSVQSKKRCRPLSDVDGDNSLSLHCKKRRLRLILITSRLSQPFSLPPTHIVYRDSTKFAIWAKQKALGRSVLRKSAILNSIRRNKDLQHEDAGDFDGASHPLLKSELSANEKKTLIFGTHDPYTHPVSAPLNPEAALAPAPVLQSPNFVSAQLPEDSNRPPPAAVSNYDALDLEDELSYEKYGDDDGGESADEASCSDIYSDFNVIDLEDNEDAEDFGFPEVFPFPCIEPMCSTVANRDRLGSQRTDLSHDTNRQQQVLLYDL